MRASPLIVILVASVPSLPSAARAQEPVTPPPTLSAPGTCPANLRVAWNVGSIAGADGVRARILKAAPGAAVGTAVAVETRDEAGATGAFTKNLRNLGPVLDGTRYFVRVRALQGGSPVASFSDAALLEQDFTPDGMFSVGVPLAPAGSAATQLKLDWSLTGPIAACADRIAWEIKKEAAFADPQAPDPAAALKGTLSGISGSRTIDVPGAGKYYLRIVARQGGDTEDDDVGRWGTARVASIAAAVALRVEVEDVVFSTCAGGSVTVPGASVRVTANGFDETRTADFGGRVTFAVPAGKAYQVTATASTCLTPATEYVTPASDADLKLRLPSCAHPRADLRLTAAEPWPGGTAGSPYSMTFAIRHGGLGGPSRPADLRVERVTPGTSTASTVATQVQRVALGAFCPSQARTVTVVDPSPLFGSWMYRATLVAPGTTTLLTDFDDASNLITRTAGFLAPAPVVADFSFLNITSFRLQGGATSVPTGTPVSLNATTTGQTPREYRAGECGSAFNAAPFRAYAASPVPTLAGFTTAGTHTVCLQLRGSSVSSGVASTSIAAFVPADLSPSVAQTSNPITAGQQQTYTVTVRNTGGVPAGGIVVRNTISANLEFVSATVGVPLNVACPRSGTTVTCTVPVLGPGQSSTIRILTRLPGTATSGHDVSFGSSVDPDGAIVESNELNNVAGAIASTLGVTPEMWGLETAEKSRLECPAGQVMNGVYGDEGLWLDNIGIVCAGSKRGYAYTSVSGGWLVPKPWNVTCAAAPGYLRLYPSVANHHFLIVSNVLCTSLPNGVGLNFDPSRVEMVPGERGISRIHCPDGAFPTGLVVSIYRAGVTNQPGISALGLICAKLRQ